MIKVERVLGLVGLLPNTLIVIPMNLVEDKERIGIASINCESELIIADEPISALDVSIQAQVINL